MNRLSLFLLSTGSSYDDARSERRGSIRISSWFAGLISPGGCSTDLQSGWHGFIIWAMVRLLRRLDGRSISRIVTLTLLLAALVTLVHWHQDSPGQRCEICFARHLPSIPVLFAARLAVPTRVEWWSQTEKPASALSASFQAKASRAPPQASSL